MRKIYILIELLMPLRRQNDELLCAHSVQCSGSSISTANDATLPEGAATLCDAFLWGQDYWLFKSPFPVLFLLPFLF